MNNNLVSQLNDVLSQWAAVFDLLSQIRLVFSVDQHKYLCLNDVQLCPAASMTLNYASYDTKQISFHFEDASEVRITILWPEEGAPFVSNVIFTSASDINENENEGTKQHERNGTPAPSGRTI